MKILLISPLPPPAGGIATWTKVYLEYCKQDIHTVDIINSALIGQRSEKVNNKRCILNEIFRSARICIALSKNLKTNKPDIVHLNSSCAQFGIIRDFLTAWLVKSKKIPLIVHFHCNAEDQLHNRVSTAFLKKTINISDEVLVLNKTTQDYIRKTCNISCKVIPNFISNDWVLKKGKCISTIIKNILFIGHVQKEKGLEDIINTAKQYPDIKFILAGPIKDSKDIYEAPSNSHFLGSVSSQEVQCLLDSADVFLFPTRSEGFSIALTEAMARGLPIITTSEGANVDMIEEKGGVIVEAGDIKGIIKAIEKLNDVETRAKISDWNINKVKNNYTDEKVMEKLLYIYNEVCSLSKTRCPNVINCKHGS